MYIYIYTHELLISSKSVYAIYVFNNVFPILIYEYKYLSG